MMPDLRLVFPFLLLAACTGRPSPSDTDGNTGTGSDTTATPGTVGPTTSAEPTTAGPTSMGSTTEGASSEATGAPSGTGPDDTGTPDTTTSTSTGDDTTEASDTTGAPPPAGCPAACDEPKVHEGDLDLEAGASTEEFACITHITGTLNISGDLGPAALAGLARLKRVGALWLVNNATLTNLDVFPCLRDVDDKVVITNAPALTDASLLGQLHTLPGLSFNSTGLTALPAFGPDHAGIGYLSLIDNDALVDLEPVADWRALPGEDLNVEIEHNDGLTSIEGVAGVITDAGNTSVGVRLVGLPKLASLAGLEPLKTGWLQCAELPLVPDLLPLSGMTTFDWLELSDMPSVTDLKGLDNLVSVGVLMLGECVNAFPDGLGMPGLKNLSGLDKLEAVHSLGLANNSGMTALTGAPALKAVNELQIVGNAGLAQADVDQFLGQLDAEPMDPCFGDWEQCSCFVILPP